MKELALRVAIIVLAAGLGGYADEPVGSFKVIVNPRVVGRKIPRDVVAQIYLGRVTRWGDGNPIVAVDLSATSSVRRAFSGAVLSMPVEGVKNYWMRTPLTARRPPMIKASDEEVIAFVTTEPGAIGYVSESTPVPPAVRVVAVE